MRTRKFEMTRNYDVFKGYNNENEFCLCVSRSIAAFGSVYEGTLSFTLNIRPLQKYERPKVGNRFKLRKVRGRFYAVRSNVFRYLLSDDFGLAFRRFRNPSYEVWVSDVVND